MNVRDVESDQESILHKETFPCAHQTTGKTRHGHQAEATLWTSVWERDRNTLCHTFRTCSLPTLASSYRSRSKSAPFTSEIESLSRRFRSPSLLKAASSTCFSIFEGLSNDKLQCLRDSRPDKGYVNEIDVQGRKRAGQQYGKGKTVLEGRS